MASGISTAAAQTGTSINGEASLAPLCGGLVPTITGTSSSDVLVGTDGDDVIHGLGGADLVRGMGGDDTICGGAGGDELHGGGGQDALFGGPGSDLLVGGIGPDTLKGGDGPDDVRGDKGNDQLGGGAGADSFFGGPGSDEIVGGPGGDVLRGGAGIDTLLGGRHGDTLKGGDAGDTLLGNRGNDTLNGGRGNDVLRGHEHRDVIRGAGGSDIMDGDAGRDVLIGAGGNDDADGGIGHDRCFAETKSRCEGKGVFWLHEAGIGALNFGTPTSTVVATLAELAEPPGGDPDEDSGWVAFNETGWGLCPGVQARSVEWGNLVALFSRDVIGADGEFFTWVVRDATDQRRDLKLQTTKGLTWSDTVSALQTIYPATVVGYDELFDMWYFVVEPSLPIKETFWGWISGGDPHDTVEMIFGGGGCGE